jgi:hypothetical protein
MVFLLLKASQTNDPFIPDRKRDREWAPPLYGTKLLKFVIIESLVVCFISPVTYLDRITG